MEVSKSLGVSRTKHIPADIGYDILRRLPAISLLRFRSVCKNWLNIIDNPSFAIVNRSTRTVAEDPQILATTRLTTVKTVHTLTYDGYVIKETDQNPTLQLDDDCYIDHAAYGFIIFRTLDGRLLLCNPLRREVLALPPLQQSNVSKVFKLECGTGFDSTTNTYKIVCMMKNLFLPETTLGVYTLSTHSWRILSSPPTSSGCLELTGEKVSAYGDMHWMARCCTTKSMMIGSFDFRKEKFKKTAAPNFGCHYHMINLKESLAVIKFSANNEQIEIWVMNDYERGRWVREKIVSTRLWVREPTVDDICIGACDDGLIFLKRDSLQVFVHNLKTNRIRYMDHPVIAGGPKKSWSELMFNCTGNVLSFRNFNNISPSLPLNTISIFLS
ncbi:F-box protein [Melia azedarach]|uniref:F-box protein n=1 Tax=Melia azedarach TaxID=155640 RepID=A0ACC1WTX4_MELAZ|nr:F-box protein [Melia azedarach]